MLEGSDVRLDTDYFTERENLAGAAVKTVYTGMLDEFYGFRYGALEYRTLRFESETLGKPDFQGNAVVNYTDKDIPWTRIIEHEHFEQASAAKTIVTREYPKEFERGDEPYYPVNDGKNNALNERYRTLALQEKNVIFGGRLADYAYYDMWLVIRNALDAAGRELT
jgi:UDP-galactopyranose mutase